MKTIEISEELYEQYKLFIDIITKAPSNKVHRFAPEKNKRYYTISEVGKCFPYNWGETKIELLRFNNFNCFETKQQTEQVAKWQRQFNAVAMACSLVNKCYDFSEDKKFGLRKNNNVWGYTLFSNETRQNEPHVSTLEQVEQAIALLEEWGI